MSAPPIPADAKAEALKAAWQAFAPGAEPRVAELERIWKVVEAAAPVLLAEGARLAERSEVERSEQSEKITDEHGNRTDTCGTCTEVPSVSGWTRMPQVGCPVHGTAMAAVVDADAPAVPTGTPDPAALLRTVAAGRREYAANAPTVTAEVLEHEARAFELAAQIASGDPAPLYSLLPSWRWTDEMNALVAAGSPTGPPDRCTVEYEGWTCERPRGHEGRHTAGDGGQANGATWRWPVAGSPTDAQDPPKPCMPYYCPTSDQVECCPTDSGWDVCCSAPELHRPPGSPTATCAVIDAAHLARQRAFSERTFGPGRRTLGVIKHIRKELVEIEAAPEDLSEWVDVAILALDGAWRAGHGPQQIIDAIVAKQARNEARTWPDWRTADPNGAIEHDRAAEEDHHDR